MAKLIPAMTVTCGLLAGCTLTSLPPLTANNPASPNGPEAVTQPLRSSLGVDNATKRTRQLVAARVQQDTPTQQEKKQSNQNMEKMPGMENMPNMEH
jgi:hypothetical protein